MNLYTYKQDPGVQTGSGSDLKSDIDSKIVRIAVTNNENFLERFQSSKVWSYMSVWKETVCM